jgi:hypothetical protein
MFNLLDYPPLILAVSLPVFWLSSSIGVRLRDNARNLQPGDRDDLKFVLSGALTLLGLIVGFTFQMALNSYDRRKILEAQEANAIGTEYARTDLLPPADAATVRALLKNYIDQRISNYTARNDQRVRQLAAQTARLQTEMWSAVAASAAAQPSPLTALALTGMDNVLDSEGYAQAAWRHHIPLAAWGLLFVISIFCNLLIGRAAQGGSGFVLLVLPVALSISLFLIAEIDSPRAGSIRVEPQNLENLTHSLRSQDEAEQPHSDLSR